MFLNGHFYSLILLQWKNRPFVGPGFCPLFFRRFNRADFQLFGDGFVGSLRVDAGRHVLPARLWFARDANDLVRAFSLALMVRLSSMRADQS